MDAPQAVSSRSLIRNALWSVKQIDDLPPHLPPPNYDRGANARENQPNTPYYEAGRNKAVLGRGVVVLVTCGNYISN